MGSYCVVQASWDAGLDQGGNGRGKERKSSNL